MSLSEVVVLTLGLFSCHQVVDALNWFRTPHPHPAGPGLCSDDQRPCGEIRTGSAAVFRANKVFR